MRASSSDLDRLETFHPCLSQSMTRRRSCMCNILTGPLLSSWIGRRSNSTIATGCICPKPKLLTQARCSRLTCWTDGSRSILTSTNQAVAASQHSTLSRCLQLTTCPTHSSTVIPHKSVVTSAQSLILCKQTGLLIARLRIAVMRPPRVAFTKTVTAAAIALSTYSSTMRRMTLALAQAILSTLRRSSTSRRSSMRRINNL